MAILLQCFAPSCATSSITLLSSSSVHGPLIALASAVSLFHRHAHWSAVRLLLPGILDATTTQSIDVLFVSFSTSSFKASSSAAVHFGKWDFSSENGSEEDTEEIDFLRFFAVLALLLSMLLRSENIGNFFNALLLCNGNGIEDGGGSEAAVIVACPYMLYAYEVLP